jgi:hypothetical protein
LNQNHYINAYVHLNLKEYLCAIPSIFSGLCLYKDALHIVMFFLGRMTYFVSWGLTVCSLTVQAVSCAIYLHRTSCVKKVIFSFPYSEFGQHFAFLSFSILNIWILHLKWFFVLLK